MCSRASTKQRATERSTLPVGIDDHRPLPELMLEARATQLGAANLRPGARRQDQVPLDLGDRDRLTLGAGVELDDARNHQRGAQGSPASRTA